MAFARFTPLFLATRAIGTEFARRLFIPIVAIVGGVLLVALIGLGWLVTMSAWWWLLYVPVILLSIVALVLGCITAFALQLLSPVRTKSQRKAIKEFVDTLQEVSDTTQTPPPFLFVRLIKDVILPSEKGIINQMSSHARSIRPDFEAIVRSYAKETR